MRLKAEKAKKILRQKSQKKLALPDVPEHLDLSIKEASSLKKIVDAKVIPSISSSKVHTFKTFLSFLIEPFVSKIKKLKGGSALYP